ncbi:DarT ssDNA thymidine ADP-ribosyltransferase family protein [Mycetocola zhadangensis]|uniref:DarT ssDNA thymidine ADP-ribosyltransferase family protein n=1 Tax=Mycetocola zhadangensis TaxID=1164595 RepID=UPI003A4D8139
MSNECKHGFENGACATCFPSAPPAPKVVVAPKRAPRPRTTSLRAAPAAGSKAAAVSAIDISEQRIYHVTHISNLEKILASGVLLADSVSANPRVDISTPENRESRRSTLVSKAGTATVADYVPFFLSPNASLWASLRSDAADPRLSNEARGTAVNDYVVLVSSIKKVRDTSEPGYSNIVVTDGDAAGAVTRLESTKDSAERMLRKLRAEEDESVAILEAEVLVETSLPFDAVSVISVATVSVRETVKEMLESTPYKAKVAAHPPWFQSAGAL